MSRNLVAANVSAVDADHVHEVIMVSLGFDTPVYVHSGTGSISYDGDTYIGVGSLGDVSGSRESEKLGPNAVTLSLNVLNSTYLAEGLNSGNLYDPVVIYVGYRADDGTLLADPWVVWSGWYESAGIKLGEENVLSMVCQHDLAILEEKDGSRFTDEDQQNRYSGDRAFQFLQNMEGVKLLWGGGAVKNGRSGGGGGLIYDPRP